MAVTITTIQDLTNFRVEPVDFDDMGEGVYRLWSSRLDMERPDSVYFTRKMLEKLRTAIEAVLVRDEILSRGTTGVKE